MTVSVDNRLLRSRSLMVSVLAVYVGICLLHWSQFPLWMVFVSPLIVLWRIQILREKLPHPSRLVKNSCSGLLCVFLFFYYDQWIAVESTVGFLLVATTLKLIEIRHRRDIVVVTFLYYFLVACGFLFEQSVLYSVASAAVVVCISAILVQLYSYSAESQSSTTSTDKQRVVSSMMLSAKLLLQSAFLAIVMLLLLPRLSPLWSVPLHSGQATTGISDSMSPGDISSLIQNDALAFRVTFVDQPLPRQTMYWRGLVFDDFDGRRWQRSQTVKQTIQLAATSVSPTYPSNEDAIEYDVLLEPTAQHWLYAVPSARVIQGVVSPIYSDDAEIFQKNTINQRMQYRVASQAQAASYTVLSNTDYRRLITLPSNSNPQAQRMAREWWQQSPNAQAYINKVLNYYRENFRYTLSPPRLGKHTVDEFLFKTQSGFCEHFSSSFTVLMRAVGIPARVVVGYHGGEWNNDNTYVNVYQRDAHAWSEVWLEGKGWIRVDPTAAVASIRIEEGVSAALPQQERAFVGGNRKTQFEWLIRARHQWHNIDYRWQRWVISYDNDKQQNLLEKYFGEMTITKVVAAVVIPLLSVASVLAFILFRHSIVERYFRRKSREEKLYASLRKKLATKGVDVSSNDSIRSLCQKAAVVLPRYRLLLEKLNADLEVIYYDISLSPSQKKPYYARVNRAIKRLI